MPEKKEIVKQSLTNQWENWKNFKETKGEFTETVHSFIKTMGKKKFHVKE